MLPPLASRIISASASMVISVPLKVEGISASPKNRPTSAKFPTITSFVLPDKSVASIDPPLPSIKFWDDTVPLALIFPEAVKLPVIWMFPVLFSDKFNFESIKSAYCACEGVSPVSKYPFNVVLVCFAIMLLC